LNVFMTRREPLVVLSALLMIACSQEVARPPAATLESTSIAEDPALSDGEEPLVPTTGDPLPGAPTKKGTSPPTTSPAAPSARCDRAKPFSAPKLAAGLNGSSYDSGARLSADELSVFFSRTSATGDILRATRVSTGDAWIGATVVSGISSSASADGAPTTTADGRTMFFQSDRAGSVGGLDIWTARRASVTAAWSTPVRVAALSTIATDADPFVRADGAEIVLSSNRSGSWDLYAAALDAADGASPPLPLAELNTAADESNPVVSADGLAIYFARRGGSQDIWVARRDAGSGPFGAPTMLVEVSTSHDERPTWISADECVLYFSSSGRADSVGSSDVYVASRPR
jgi:WD40-like Beta Propeller Repeat